MAEVKLVNIKKSYGPVEVIKGIDLDIRHGEFVVFVGPSGCGKSTLLRMIAGLEDITAGDLYIGEARCNTMQPRDRGVAMVFQSYALYPHMTVYENMGFGLTLAKTPKEEKDRQVREAARILQMEHLLDRKPAQLSGGQRQRVAIGRAIVRNPQVFLFDEPLSNLDAALRGDMRMEIAKLHNQLGATMIYVTHDQIEAMTLADKIVVLNLGIVQQVGSPLELYHRPANKFVAGFIGAPKMNFLDVTVEEAGPQGVRVKSADLEEMTLPLDGSSLKPGDAVSLGIRPQDMSEGDEVKKSIGGTVRFVERLGSETIANIAVGDDKTLIAALHGDHQVNSGDHIRLGFPVEKAHLFGSDERALPALKAMAA